MRGVIYCNIVHIQTNVNSCHSQFQTTTETKDKRDSNYDVEKPTQSVEYATTTERKPNYAYNLLIHYV